MICAVDTKLISRIVTILLWGNTGLSASSEFSTGSVLRTLISSDTLIAFIVLLIYKLIGAVDSFVCQCLKELWWDDVQCAEVPAGGMRGVGTCMLLGHFITHC